AEARSTACRLAHEGVLPIWSPFALVYALACIDAKGRGSAPSGAWEAAHGISADVGASAEVGVARQQDRREMEVQSRESQTGSRKVLIGLCVLAAIGGVALFEWDMTPGSGRYRAGGQNAGPGPARYLVMREWRRNTDYRFTPSAERKRHPEGGLL